MSEGWVKIHRELFGHPIWINSTPEQKVILVTLICMANHEPSRWEWNGQIFEVGRGQMVTSLESIAEKCGNGVSVRNVRTALQRFEKLEFLTNKSTNRGRLITICNYCKWQDVPSETDKQTDRQLTSNRQATDKHLTTNKNDKNNKNEKNGKNNKDKYSAEREEIIAYFNEVCGTKYRPDTKAIKKLIDGLLDQNFTVDDFKTVIYKKAKQWLHDPEMCKFVRPQTLFTGKFEGYLNEVEALSFEERLWMA